MTKRCVLYNFHFLNDNWCAGQVKNIGVIEGNISVLANE